jgi:hypothetical protein
VNTGFLFAEQIKARVAYIKFRIFIGPARELKSLIDFTHF